LQANAAAAIIVLLAVILAVNLVAILLRNRMSESGDPMDTEVSPTVADQPEHLGEATRLAVTFDRSANEAETLETVFDVDDVSVYYGDFRAVRNVTLPIYRNQITALIGPSGCGKTTFIRCLNRMNDLIEGARVEGRLCTRRGPLRSAGRRGRGQAPDRHGVPEAEPVPKSVYENIAFGPKIAGYKGNMDDLVEEALSRAALWTRSRTS